MADKQADWKFLHAHQTTGGRITLNVATPGGSVREVPISDLQAVVLIRQLAGALVYSVEKMRRSDDSE